MATETTLVLVKPDGVQRGLVGRIIARFEDKGLELVGLKLMVADKDLLGQHYSEHQGKPFYDGLVGFMSGGPIVAMAWRGDEAIAVVRGLMGTTDGRKAPPGTIRGDHGMSRSYNLVHGSDGPPAAEKELGLFFPEGLVEGTYDTLRWVYDPSDD